MPKISHYWGHRSPEINKLHSFLSAPPEQSILVPRGLLKQDSGQFFRPHYQKKDIGGKTCEYFGVSMWNKAENKLDYFIGIATENAEGDISGTQELQITGGLYALFQTPETTHVNFVNTIHRTWEYINRVWLEQNSYKRRDSHEFECYKEQSRVFSERIYIPITKNRS